MVWPARRAGFFRLSRCLSQFSTASLAVELTLRHSFSFEHLQRPPIDIVRDSVEKNFDGVFQVTIVFASPSPSRYGRAEEAPPPHVWRGPRTAPPSLPAHSGRGGGEPQVGGRGRGGEGRSHRYHGGSGSSRILLSEGGWASRTGEAGRAGFSTQRTFKASGRGGAEWGRPGWMPPAGHRWKACS